MDRSSSDTKMAKLLIILLLIVGLIGAAISEETRHKTKVRNRYAFLGDKGLLSPFARDCYTNYPYGSVKIFDIETFIELIERLENEVANSTEYVDFNSPDKIARMILHRFNLEAVNYTSFEQDPNAENTASMDTRIIGTLPNVIDYWFPDYLYTNPELCSLLFMVSHNFEIHKETIQEQGVLSFGHDKSESIAITKVLIGAAVGLHDGIPLVSGKEISTRMIGTAMPNEITLQDTILALTFGELMGSASFFEFKNNPLYDSKLIFGSKGLWNANYTAYELVDVKNVQMLTKSNRGSLAQIRGALDGFIIGKQLKKNVASNRIKLSLSTILSSYYSSPQISQFVNKLGVNYCNRFDEKPLLALLSESGSSYNKIYNYVFSRDGALYHGDLIQSFLNQASSTQQDFCNKAPSPKKTYKIRCTVDEL